MLFLPKYLNTQVMNRKESFSKLYQHFFKIT